jgi:LacI family transcriptional regulator
VLLADSEQDVGQELSHLRLMRNYRAAGTILCPTGAGSDYTTLERDLGAMTVVAVDHILPGHRHDSVTLDNTAAGEVATRHIVEHGHWRVATIAGPLHLQPAVDRLRGFENVLQAAGITLDPALILNGAFREEGAFTACRMLLARPDRPSALFVSNNQMLIGAMRAIAMAGLRCPDDISVTAVDDFPWAAAFTPALTTVRQPVDAMAQAALKLLLERLAGVAGPARTVVLQPDLVVRNSCAKPRDQADRGSRSLLDKGFAASP